MRWIKYFFISQTHEKAVLQLCLLVLVARIGLHLIDRQHENRSLAVLQKLPSCPTHTAVSKLKSPYFSSVATSSQPKVKKAFPFNPNTASHQQLLDLGFKEWQVKNIVKYRDSGGRFRFKSDIKKIYGISPEHYRQLLLYIDLPEKESAVQPRLKARPLQKMDLNKADSLSLGSLTHIRPWLLKRILLFRERLGGFYAWEQVAEVYGIDSAALNQLRKQFYLDSLAIQPLHINRLSEAQLASHPYISNKTAKLIYRYRVQHGPYTAIKELSKSVLMPDSTLVKIAPYLRFDE